MASMEINNLSQHLFMVIRICLDKMIYIGSQDPELMKSIDGTLGIASTCYDYLIGRIPS